MARKSLKSKLKSQLRQAKHERDVEFEKAGITINYELAVMQSVCMAHGVMATMMLAAQTLGEDDEKYHIIQEQSQARIAQCHVALIGLGLSHEEANARIIKGH